MMRLERPEHNASRNGMSAKYTRMQVLRTRFVMGVPGDGGDTGAMVDLAWRDKT